METEQPSTLHKGWFNDAPFPMLATDDGGRIRWANNALESCVGLPASQLLGHTRDSLPAPAYKVLLDSHELLHLQGPGAPDRWLEHSLCKSQDANGSSLQLHCYRDVTEQRRLRHENHHLQEALAELQLTDELTGLPNERALSQAINQQVSRSRRYNNPLSVLLVRLAPTATGEHTEATLQAVARLLRDRLRWVDQLGRWRDDTFLAVLPETGEPELQALIEKIQASLVEETQNRADHPLLHTSLIYGQACWQKGDDARVLLRRASQGLGADADLARLG